jgi:hypothetical protein
MVIIKGLNIYVYTFINIETREAYRVLFQKIFKILSDIRRKPIR